MNIERYIKLSKGMIDKVPNKREKHFTFILKGKKIVSIGWNNPISNKKSIEYGYCWGDKHSELSAILKLGEENCSKYTLINIHLNKNGDIKLAKPCETCRKVLNMFSFRKIFYSTKNSVIAEKL